ncbi:molybdate ABC transporter permease subunit [Alphaproteobacteria bacterium]|nr:molybdate ABC transporter permease subunit [Alphaproteobacteria bacterium]
MSADLLKNLDFSPFWITIKLALITTIILYLLCIPLAWWLAHTKLKIKVFVESLISMPLVLPPTVIGFYFLIIFNPNSFFGGLWISITGTTLTFSFSGLVLCSIIYSLPFVVQPLQNTFSEIGRSPIEAALNLGAGKFDIFINIILPLSLRGIIVAGVLGFTHTLGEFGIVLMVGGGIPNETRVISIAIFDYVENLEYESAHFYSLFLIIFSFLMLFIIYSLNKNFRLNWIIRKK